MIRRDAEAGSNPSRVSPRSAQASAGRSWWGRVLDL